MRSYARRRGEIFRRVRFPNALPYLFSALEGRDRTRDDRRHRRGLLRRLDQSARDPDPALGRASSPSRRRGRRSSSPASSASRSTARRPRRAADDELAPSARSARRSRADQTEEGEHVRKERRVALCRCSRSRLVLALAGCGGDDDEARPRQTTRGGEPTDRSPLQLKWVTQAQFAGYYAAPSRATTRTRASTSRSSPAGPTSSPSRSCSAGRPSSGSTGSTTRSRRATRAARSSTSRRSSRAAA